HCYCQWHPCPPPVVVYVQRHAGNKSPAGTTDTSSTSSPASSPPGVALVRKCTNARQQGATFTDDEHTLTPVSLTSFPEEASGCEATPARDDGDGPNTIEQEEDGDVDTSPTESSCSDRHFFVGAERLDVSTDTERLVAERQSMEARLDDAKASVPKILPEDVAVGGLRDSGKGYEKTDGYSATRGEPSIACVAEEAMAAAAGRSESKSPDLPPVEKRESSPDTATTGDEDDQDYNFVFDDEEPGDSCRKNVRFSDQALWRVH
ncbi:unnamed protein product, partial [Ectocarpus sp. 12 AP-2014]